MARELYISRSPSPSVWCKNYKWSVLRVKEQVCIQRCGLTKICLSYKPNVACVWLETDSLHLGHVIGERDRCKRCHGDKVVEERKVLEVIIKAGMWNGHRIAFKGEGDQAVRRLSKLSWGSCAITTSSLLRYGASFERKFELISSWECDGCAVSWNDFQRWIPVLDNFNC